MEAISPKHGMVGTRDHLNLIIKRLAAEGLIEPVAMDPYEQRWRTTIKGNAVCNASAARPITRATATKALEALVARAESITANLKYAYQVEQLTVFGSYLDPAMERLGDVDVAVVFAPRHTDRDKQEQLCQTRIDQAIESGRSFSSFVDRVFWPQREVRLALRHRSRAISLHEEDPRRLTDRLEVIYRLVSGTAIRT